jgi:hypothetical protein
MKERNLDILGLCETRMNGNGRELFHEDYMSLFDGAYSKKHGVAFTVTPLVEDETSDVMYVNKGMMVCLSELVTII